MDLFHTVVKELCSFTLKLVKLEAFLGNNAYLVELVLSRILFLPLAVQKWLELPKVFLLVRNHNFLHLFYYISIWIVLNLLQEE